MDIWNEYLHEKKQKENGKYKNGKYKKKYLKKRYDKSYDEIETHVLDTPETKENHLSQVIGNLPRKKKCKSLKYFSNIIIYMEATTIAVEDSLVPSLDFKKSNLVRVM